MGTGIKGRERKMNMLTQWYSHDRWRRLRSCIVRGNWRERTSSDIDRCCIARSIRPLVCKVMLWDHGHPGVRRVMVDEGIRSMRLTTAINGEKGYLWEQNARYHDFFNHKRANF